MSKLNTTSAYKHSDCSDQLQAQRLIISGRVQGVGFRPFVYKLAKQHKLSGWVQNNVGIVETHVQGNINDLNAFKHEIVKASPPLAEPVINSCISVKPIVENDFRINISSNQGEAKIHIPPDMFTCDDCLQELSNPSNRRYRYPFINCTQCGPRYTLIKSMPYDRPNTSMSDFKLCSPCEHEYTDVLSRRFHAEPVACTDCGPELWFKHNNEFIRGNETALHACVQALNTGAIVAVKGIGGYHLMCDARNDVAVKRLRQHKPRPHKPLAVMFPAPFNQPSQSLSQAVILSSKEKHLLLSPGRPIVLATKSGACNLSPLIAPGLTEIGVMLPYSPLHHLLLNDFDGPVVATSANLSGEPVLTDNNSIDKRLSHVADAYLYHDRPIVRPADDPVFRVIANKARPLRLGRGFAPTEIELPFSLNQTVLALGGHMKNTITLAWSNRAVISPHIGEMHTARSLEVFNNTVNDLQALYGVTADQIVCDAHPGYATTRWAMDNALPYTSVFHHHAHASSAFNFDIDNNQSALVFTWDGVGYGEDGSLWGGEALIGRPGAWQRYASMRPFYLQGGDNTGREPWRSAASLCWELGKECSIPVPAHDQDRATVHHAWQRKINTAATSSVGRLFDAAAALTGLCMHASFEGQGPMLLESICGACVDHVRLPVHRKNGLLISDWSPLVDMLCDAKRSVAERAENFHSSMAHALLKQAQLARLDHGIDIIGLSGGVFQNRVLTELAIDLLKAHGFMVMISENIPLNDAGLSYGQVIEYAHSH